MSKPEKLAYSESRMLLPKLLSAELRGPVAEAALPPEQKNSKK